MSATAQLCHRYSKLIKRRSVKNLLEGVILDEKTNIIDEKQSIGNLRRQTFSIVTNTQVDTYINDCRLIRAWLEQVFYTHQETPIHITWWMEYQGKINELLLIAVFFELPERANGIIVLPLYITGLYISMADVLLSSPRAAVIRQEHADLVGKFPFLLKVVNAISPALGLNIKE